MKLNLDLDVHHLSRVEGHGNIVVRVRDGKLEEARWDSVETPRFFEVMLQGKHYSTAGVLAARICGICSIAHCLASLRATEQALGVTVPEAAETLRQLAKHGETLQSHALHLLFLVAPDFLGLTSVVPLIDTKPEIVEIAARLKGLANRLCDTVAGRTTHPISLQVGGVARMPDRSELAALREQLYHSLEDLDQVVELFKGFEAPAFERETEFVSLEGEDRYPFVGDKLVSSDGVRRPEREYLAVTNEYVVERNTSKWTRLSRSSYAVGALARYNNNHRWIHDHARRVAESLGLRPVCHNPFMNNAAQLAECFHCTHEAIRLINALVDERPGPTMAAISPRAGEGVGAVEAPRGILFHHYEYDRRGRIVRANCVVPTTQNNANIHQDLSALVEHFVAQGADGPELERLCAMLVRAYDPCLSCSVH